MGSCEQMSKLKTWHTSDSKCPFPFSALSFFVCLFVFTLNHIILSSVPKSFKYQMPNWHHFRYLWVLDSVHFSSVTQSCPTLCNPIDCSMPGLPVHHQLPEFTQTHVHWVSDVIQSSHPWSHPLLEKRWQYHKVCSLLDCGHGHIFLKLKVLPLDPKPWWTEEYAEMGMDTQSLHPRGHAPECSSSYKVSIPIKSQFSSPYQWLGPFLNQNPSGDKKALKELRTPFCWEDSSPSSRKWKLYPPVQVQDSSPSSTSKGRGLSLLPPKGVFRGKREEVALPNALWIFPNSASRWLQALLGEQRKSMGCPCRVGLKPFREGSFQNIIKQLGMREKRNAF